MDHGGLTNRGAATVPAAEPWRGDRLFYCSIAWTIGALVVVAFSKALLTGAFEPATLHSPFTYAHAIVYCSWIALFVTQATLVSAQRLDLHRRLGVIGIALACAMVALSVVSTVRAFALGLEKYFFANPHIEVVVFATLVAPALFHRRNADVHKRLMLLATIGLMGAATTHLPLIGRISPIAFLLVQDSLIAAGIGYDMLSRRRVHHTYLWGGALIIASQFLIRSAPAMSGVPATG